MNQRWTCDVKEDPQTGDAILEFPPELLEAVGWKEGDVLHWAKLNNGSWSLTKKVEDKKILYQFTNDEFDRTAEVYKKGAVYGVSLYAVDSLIEDRVCEGKSLCFIDDLALNWIYKIGEFKK